MIQWNQPKCLFFQIIHFLKKKKCIISQLLAPLFLVSGTASPAKDNGTERIFIMFNKVGEHIWRDLGPSLHAEPFKMLRFALMDCPLQFRPHVSIGFRSRD